MLNIRFGLLALASTLSLVACGLAGDSAESRNASIIGTDERVFERDEKLNQTIGSLDYKGTAICSAFASGKDEITTSAHCLPKNPDTRDFSVTIQKKKYPVQAVNVLNKADLAVLKVTGLDQYLESAPVNDKMGSKLTAYSIEKRALVSTQDKT